MVILRALLRPFGYLAFVAGLMALSATARLLGEEHELGYFCGRLAKTMWSYPEVVRRGVQMAWLVWLVLFVIALTLLDPLAALWDQVALAAVALAAIWRRLFDGHRAAR